MYKHSVSLEASKCTGCTTCLRHCPTEAIRIKDSKAVINSDRCIDCGECIRVCPNGAKYTVCDKLEDLNDYKWKIALPAPTLFGQFPKVEDVKLILEGLYELGFDDVYEVSYAAEFISAYTKKYIRNEQHPTPLISSACPAIVRLVSLRFPTLTQHLLPIMPPVELAAQLARSNAKRKHPNFRYEDIAVCLITPCPAKISYTKNPTESFKSNIDCCISINDIYFKLINNMPKKLDKVDKLNSSMLGINWAVTGGESIAVMHDKYLAADGIENSISILEEIEKGKLTDLEFVELLACPGGCVGGVLTVENAYIAKARLQSLSSQIPFSGANARKIDNFLALDDIEFSMSPAEVAVSGIGSDFKESMRMMAKIQEIYNKLPCIDCGVCGAPNCRAFAEDVVKGEADIDSCIVQKYEKLQKELDAKTKE